MLTMKIRLNRKGWLILWVVCLPVLLLILVLGIEPKWPHSINPSSCYFRVSDGTSVNNERVVARGLTRECRKFNGWVRSQGWKPYYPDSEEDRLEFFDSRTNSKLGENEAAIQYLSESKVYWWANLIGAWAALSVALLLIPWGLSLVVRWVVR